MCLSAVEVQLMDGKKIEFAELAFENSILNFFQQVDALQLAWIGEKNKYAEIAFLKFNFYLGQQVAFLCADKTTGNWKLNS